MRRCFYGLLALVMLGAMVNVGWGQVSISAIESAYTQDFNTLATSGTSNTWTDNSTITGWYSNRTVYLASTGSSTTGGLYSFGSTSATDRTLGALSSSSVSPIFGVRLVNNTGVSIGSISVSFTGEQWRITANAQVLTFEYQVGASSISSGTWTAVSDLNFTAPVTGTAAAVDGNTSTYRTSLSKTITVSVADDQEIWFRWSKSGSTSPGLGVDDISITAYAATTPTLSVTPSSLSDFSYISGSGPSSSQTYSLSGSNLTGAPGNITITGSTNYEVSTDNSTFSSSTTVAYSSSTLDATAIYVRLKSGLSAGSYNSETVTNSGGGASDVSVTCSGTVYKVEPTNHVTNFTAAKDGTFGNSRIDLSWTANDGSQIPDGYLIKASTSDNITDPSDGTAVSDNTTIGSNSGAINITYGTNSYEWTGLTAEQTYYFKIYPYTNSSTNINYKTDATVPNANVTTGTAPAAPDVFFSEYIEGSSNNKALEIYNATGSSISLNLFSVKLYTNGSSTASYTFAFDSNPTLANNDVYVIYNSSASSSISSVGDATSTVTYFNGDDAVGLYYGDILIDVVGSIGTDPGTAWSVAGTTDATVNYTLVRKHTVTTGNTNWTTSAGTSSDDSEWIVYTTDTFDYLGSHTSDASLPVSLTSFAADGRGGTVVLSWRTESETENLGFIIQRQLRVTSSGLRVAEWEEIASYTTVESLQGHSSTTEAHEYSYTDAAVVPGMTYSYRLADVDYSGKAIWHNAVEVTVPESGSSVPTEFGLQKAYPNPFNPRTTFSYQLPEPEFVNITVYDVNGRRVAVLLNDRMVAGTHQVNWEPRNLISGIYLIRIQAGSFTSVQKCVLVK